MNSSQLAFIALEAERILSEEAKARQVESGRVFGRGQEKVVEKIPQAINQQNQPPKEPKSRDKAAELVGGTNARYVQEAKKIARDAPEVRELVMSGKMNMSDAAKVANLTN